MAQPTYPLAPVSLGAGMRHAVSELDQWQGWNLVARNEGVCQVWLTPHFATGGWTVRTAAGPVGVLSAEVRHHYRDVDAVTQSGYLPSTRAFASVGEYNTVSLDIELPLAELTVPRNNLPAGVSCLPQGGHFLVDTEASADQEAVAELTEGANCQVLVTLSDLNGATVVAFGQRVLGTIDMDVESSVVGARAFVVDGAIIVDADPAATDHTHLVPALSTLPQPPVEPEPEADPGAEEPGTLPENLFFPGDYGDVPHGSRTVTGPPDRD